MCLRAAVDEIVWLHTEHGRRDKKQTPEVCGAQAGVDLANEIPGSLQETGAKDLISFEPANRTGLWLALITRVMILDRPQTWSTEPADGEVGKMVGE